ncbi:MAG: hypothetical protein M1540_02750 [Candidatus Bathyarchaeota archaeon]|nr:hypothetical protein [Candidatus Bathyarchaeota archaeon]
MKRVNLFLILLITAIAALIATTALGFVIFYNQQDPYNWMSQMWGNGRMGGMMGQTPTPTPTANTFLPYYGVLFAVLIAVTVIAVIGVTYYLVYPQIRVGTHPIQPPQSLASQPNGNASSAYESVSKTLTDDERKVVDALKAHNGKYLQKYLKSETGLSRLQTHRIIARLTERGIVTIEKTGNTNQVTLAEWLNKQ